MWNLIDWSEVTLYLKQQFIHNEFFSGAAIVGAASWILYQIKPLPKFLYERIKRKMTYSVTVYQTNEMYDFLEKWFFEKHENSYRNVQMTTERHYDDDGNLENIEMHTRHLEDYFIIRRGFRWLSIWKQRETLEHASNLDSYYLNNFEISGIFAKSTINKMMEEVKEFNQKRIAKQDAETSVYINSIANWNKMHDVEPKPLSKIFIKNKHEIVEDIDNFIKNKSWYTERGILHKRGYLLYGKAGNGKTSLILSLAKHFKKDIYLLNPTRITDADLIRLYSNMTKNSILVVEDIDAVFNAERDKQDENIKFNFSTLLNCLDGALSKEGIITFFTTNHPERLDTALIRSGRMDFHFEITNPSDDMINEFVSNFYDGKPVRLDRRISYKVPMVKVQEYCMSNDFKTCKKKLNEIT